MMTNKSYLYLALGLSALVSCADDEFQKPNEFSDVSWHMSVTQSNRNPIVVSLGKFLSIADASQNAIEHWWEVSEDSTFFLKGPMGFGIADYTPFIDSSIPHRNQEPTVHVLFQKAGTHTIRLRNTFNEPVCYRYSLHPELTPDEIGETYSVPMGGVHVFDTTFVVEVYDNVLVNGWKAFKDKELAQEIEISTDSLMPVSSVEIEYGDTLWFVDDSYDRPDTWSWECIEAGIKKIEGDTVAMKFTKLTENTPFKVRHTIQRIGDNNIPEAAIKSTTVPLNIIVKPSSKPIHISNAELIDGNKVQLTLSNAAFEASSFTAGNAADFSLAISNSYNGRDPYSGSAKGKALKVGLSDNILQIEFDSPLYNTDELVLNYIPGAEKIATIDGRNLEAISAMDINENMAEVLPDSIFNFNVAGLDPGWYRHEGDVTGSMTWEVVDDPLDSVLTDGIDKCLLVDIKAIPTRLMNSYTFSAPAGTYTMYAKIMVPGTETQKSGLSLFITDTKTFGNTEFTGGGGQNAGWITINNWVKDTWYQHKKTFKSPGGTDRRFAISNNVYLGKYYIKDLRLTNEQLRP